MGGGLEGWDIVTLIIFIPVYSEYNWFVFSIVRVEATEDDGMAA